MPDSSLGRYVPARGCDVTQSPAERSADFGHLEGGRDMTFLPSHHAQPYSNSSERITLQKGAIGWVLAPYHDSRDCQVR